MTPLIILEDKTLEIVDLQVKYRKQTTTRGTS